MVGVTHEKFVKGSHRDQLVKPVDFLGLHYSTISGLVNAALVSSPFLSYRLKLTSIFSAARLDHIADRQHCTFPDGRLLQD